MRCETVPTEIDSDSGFCFSNSTRSFALLIGESLPEGLKCDLEAERAARMTLVETIGICEQANDYVSRAMVSTILDETEQHIDFLETQIELIGKVGVENYLQSQM